MQSSARSKRDNQSTISKLNPAIQTVKPKGKKKNKNPKFDDSFSLDPYADLGKDFQDGLDKDSRMRRGLYGGSNTQSHFEANSEIHVTALDRKLDSN